MTDFPVAFYDSGVTEEQAATIMRNAQTAQLIESLRAWERERRLNWRPIVGLDA